jgi:Domain of unknown function (DUF4124)
MRTAVLVFALLVSLAAAAEDIWRWVDRDGVVHYSDRPAPGAEKIDLKVQTYTPPPAPAAASVQPAESRKPTEPVTYRSVEIWEPAQDQAIVNMGGNLSVRMRVDPELAPGDSIYLYVDGQRYDDAAHNALDIDLTDVPRGSHTLAAVVTDPQGKTLIQSPPVVFHIVQTSVATPPQGPALRLKPKPHGNAAATKLPSGDLQPSYEVLDDRRRGIPTVSKSSSASGPHH